MTKKNKRLHVYATKEVDEYIRSECDKQNISICDYLSEKAEVFQTRDIDEKLKDVIAKVDKLAEIKGINLDNCYWLSERGFVMDNFEDNKNTMKAEQFHLRVTQETYDKIKQKANEYSMTMSDYVVFAVTHFNLLDLTQKVEQIDNKLNAIIKHSDMQSEESRTDQ
jgi:hypothetical protein